MVDLTGYKLTFDDEFNSLSVSQSGQGTVWADIRPYWRMNANADIGFGDSAFVDAGSGINPFSIQNGALNIQAIQTSDPVVGPGHWASGLLQTENSFSQTYGYFEIRAQLPADTGVWPAFWMLPANDTWPPEVDVFEAYGTPDLYQTVHTGVTGQDSTQTTWSDQPSMLTGFHSYGVLWTANSITFYFDGTAVGEQPVPADLHQPMYMLIDLAMQRIGGVSSTPKSMQVDYVRVYSSDPSATAVPLGTVSSPDGLSTADLHGASAAPAAGILRFVDTSDLAAPSLGDVVFTNNGSAVVWLSTGNAFSQIAVPNAGMGAEWSAYRTGDFNGDGKSDILWTNVSGQVAVSLMNGANVAQVGVPAGRMGSEWQVAGIGDFNGDGLSDIFWKSTAGDAAIWSMNGTSLTGVGTPNGHMGAEWRVATTGDFNGDRKSDVLWVSSSGGVALWLMNGNNLVGFNGNLGHMGSEWHVAGVGDFNGDGTADIVWVDTNNNTQIWYMNRGQISQFVTPSGHNGVEWLLKGVGNFSGAGSDLLWLTQNGSAQVWHVNGTQVTVSQPTTPPATIMFGS